MDNIELAKGVYDAYRNRDSEYVDRVFADDIELNEFAAVPWGGHYEGKDGFATFSRRAFEMIDATIEPGGFFETGDTVVQFGRSTGTVKTTGRAFDVAVVHLLTVQADRIVRFDSYMDAPAMLAALAGE